MHGTDAACPLWALRRLFRYIYIEAILDGLERELTINADSIVVTRIANHLRTGKVERVCINGLPIANDLVYFLLD